MKKFLILLFICCTFLILFSCSESPQVVNSDSRIPTAVLVERPQFIETRPPEVVANFIMDMSDVLPGITHKKPPKPPPDTSSGDPNPNPAHKYAYVVGISNYEGTANDLQYCDDDALAMKSWLQGEGFSVQMDLNLNATGDNITDGLQWLINQAEPGDEIAFCYSGHGAKAPGYGSSIISSDLYYVTHGYVMSYFNAVDCTKKLTTLDACVMGDFHLDTESGTFMATASNRRNSYDAPSLNHGAWTYYWLDGVEENGLIYAEDAAPYAEDGMKDWAAIYRLKVDPKHSDKYTGDMDM